LSAGIGRKRVSGDGFSAEGTAWSVSVMQTFEYPGRVSLRKAIANQDIELAELGLEQFRETLKARARISGYKLLAAQQRAEAARDVADRVQELLSFLVQREPGGITPLIELRIVEASVVTFRKQAIDANEELQSALFEVNRLRGKPLGTPLRVVDFNPSFSKPAPLDQFLAAARNENFDIRMRQAELEQQGLKVSLSENQRWPEIAAGPFYSQESAVERETVAGIGISLPLPIWNRNAGNADVHNARQQQAQVSLFLTQLEVEQEVMEHYLAYELNSQELARWQDDSLKRFHEAAELGDRHYRLGSLPIATYIELQREYLSAIDSILSLKAEALAAQQQLEVLTGLLPGSVSTSASGEKPE
jgi:cobalt-zinc-cadmium efflux system outer membrane protein